MIRVRLVRGKNIAATFRGIALLGALLLALFPVYWMLTLATETQGEVVAAHVRLLPTFHSFGGISHLAGTPVALWLANSALVSLGTAGLSIALAVFPAYALSRFRFRGAGTFGFAVFATQMLPPALLVVPLYVIFSVLALINNLLCLVLADAAFAMPIALWVIKGAIDGVPRELDEAGMMDGGSSLLILLRIIVPLVRPAIAAAAIIAFFFGWNDFLFANTFMVTESRWTATKGLASLFGQVLGADSLYHGVRCPVQHSTGHLLSPAAAAHRKRAYRRSGQINPMPRSQFRGRLGSALPCPMPTSAVGDRGAEGGLARGRRRRGNFCGGGRAGRAESRPLVARADGRTSGPPLWLRTALRAAFDGRASATHPGAADRLGFPPSAVPRTRQHRFFRQARKVNP